MIDALQAKYPDRQIEDGGNTNSEDGEALLAGMRAKGKVLPAKPSPTGKKYDEDFGTNSSTVPCGGAQGSDPLCQVG